MGLTPLEGVPMGTRSGDIDPAIIFFLAEQGGMPLAQVNQVLNRNSGLLGLSGVSNDLREVQQAAAQGNHQAELALEVYAYRIRKYIGAYLAALGGAQAVVFTGGIGEHGDLMRARILQGLDALGIRFDADRNRQCRGVEGEITAPGSPIRALVIPTNEELMIARDTWAVARSLASPS
jgi:acetate kinase